MNAGSTPGALLDGRGVRDAFATAAAHLRESARAVDAINVYPVPDGDTGSNMAATLREAVDRTLALPGKPGVGEVLRELANGALYGGRGNSGIILSQALRGLAEGVGEPRNLDARVLAAGLTRAAEAAYRAVSKPVEGTMLTVLRASGEAAAEAAAALPRGGAGVPCASTLAAAIRAAEEAEANTPTQLPALAEAGVTDAGGEGVCVILRGLLGAITGEIPPVPAMPERPIAASAEHRREEFGFCTEFILEAVDRELQPDRVRALAASAGNRSVVVVGDAAALRVHAHSDAPDALLESAGALGRVTRVKVEDMGAQNVRFGETGTGAGTGVALLALSPGPGFDRLFASLGAAVSLLGELTKPAAGELAAAADALRRPDIILLPNHKNVLLAARQAAGLASATLHVVPSQTMPQGVAAALAFDPDESVAKNLAAMEAALESVTTVELTVAAATRTADGVEAREGEVIALVDDRLVASEASVTQALRAGLIAAGAPGASLITLYAGAEVDADERERLRATAAEVAPKAEVELIDGGQRLYPVIASIE